MKQTKAKHGEIKLSSIFIISATTTTSDSKQKQKKTKRRRIDKQRLGKKERGGMAIILITFLSGFQGYFTIFIKFNAICETGIEQRAGHRGRAGSIEVKSPPHCSTSIKFLQIMERVYIRDYMYVWWAGRPRTYICMYICCMWAHPRSRTQPLG